MIKTISAAATALLLTGVAAPAMAQTWLPNWDARPNWTGGYVGVFGGATVTNDQEDERLGFDRNLDGRFGDTVTTAANADAFSPGFCDGSPNGVTPTAGCDSDSSGSIGGIRAGYDFQFGSFVVGAQAEYAGVVGAEDTVTGYSTTPATYVFTRKLESLGTVKARVGYAFGPALIYGAGGVAMGKIDNRFFSSNTANTFTPSQTDDDAEGYQAGGGMEYMLAPNLSVTAEYMYTSLQPDDYTVRVGRGTAPATNPFVLPPNATGTDIIRSNGRFGMHDVRIGMNYRF